LQDGAVGDGGNFRDAVVFHRGGQHQQQLAIGRDDCTDRAVDQCHTRRGRPACEHARHLIGATQLGRTAQPHRRRIGYVFQDARLFPHLDVAENLDYGRRMNGLPRDGAQQKRVTDLLDIGHLLDRRPGKLSGGERQRVALGRALLSKPRLLLLDEPLGSLDEGRKIEILPYLVRLRDEANVPMVYVSHDPAELRQLATQIVILRSGRVTELGGVKVLAR